MCQTKVRLVEFISTPTYKSPRGLYVSTSADSSSSSSSVRTASSSSTISPGSPRLYPSWTTRAPSILLQGGYRVSLTVVHLLCATLKQVCQASLLLYFSPLLTFSLLPVPTCRYLSMDFHEAALHLVIETNSAMLTVPIQQLGWPESSA